MKYLKLFILIFVFSIPLLAQKEKSDWLVQIHFKSGSSLNGVIKNGVFVEKKVFGSDFKILSNQNNKMINDLQKQSSRSIQSNSTSVGLRLWYVRNSNGFTFIPYRNIKEIIVIEKGYNALPEVNKKLKEMKLYADRQQKLEAIQEREEEIKRLLLQKKEKEKEKEKPKIQLSKQEEELVKKFPPGPEWNKEEYDKFHKRLNNARNNFTKSVVNGRTVISKGPINGGLSTDEKFFYDNYDLWVTAIEKDKQIKELAKLQEQEKLLQNSKKTPKNNEKETNLIEESVDSTRNELGNITEKKDNQKAETVLESDFLSIEKETRVLFYSQSANEKMESSRELAKMGRKAKKAISPLIYIAQNKDENSKVRYEAFKALAAIFTDEPEIIQVFGGALDEKNLTIRKFSVYFLSKINKDLSSIKNSISIGVVDQEPKIRFKVLLLIAEQKFVSEKNIVSKRVILETDEDVRIAAIYTLLTLDNSEKIKKWIRSRYQTNLNNAIANSSGEVKSIAQKILDLLRS